jgi:hypothetical protein
MNATLTVLAWVLGGILSILIYFIPSYIAVKKDHKNKAGIILLNLFLGWSVIGYIVSLVWAMSNPRETVQMQGK